MNCSTDTVFDMFCMKFSPIRNNYNNDEWVLPLRNLLFKLFSYLLSTTFRGNIQASCHSQAELMLPQWTLGSISRVINLLGLEGEHLTSMKASGRHQDFGPS